MPQRNRDRIMQQSLYDLLCSMNEQIRNNDARIERSGTSSEACIMDCFMDFAESQKRCIFFKLECKDCIAAWVNEFPV